MKSIGVSLSVLRVGDDHAFARRQPVGLDHHGKAQSCRRRPWRRRRRGSGDRRRWECRLRAKVFDETLGAFQHRGRLGRARARGCPRPRTVPQPATSWARRAITAKSIRFSRGEFDQSAENPWPGSARIRPPPRSRHCRARNRAWSAGGLPPAPRPAHVRGRPTHQKNLHQPHSGLAIFRRKRLYHDPSMSETANRPPLCQSARIFGQRIVRRPQAHGGGAVSLCAGAGRDFGPEIPFLRPCLFRPEGRQGGAQRRDLEAARRAPEGQARAGLEVVCTGRITTYAGSSRYQIIVEQVELAGLGALMAHAGGAQEAARRRRPVRCRAQEEAAVPARGDRRDHLAHRRGDPRHHAPAECALSRAGCCSGRWRCRASARRPRSPPPSRASTHCDGRTFPGPI